MSGISEAFEQHLRSLSDLEWNDLTRRVRPAPPGGSGVGLLNENEGIQEAIRRGYLDADGNPKSGGTR